MGRRGGSFGDNHIEKTDILNTYSKLFFYHMTGALCKCGKHRVAAANSVFLRRIC